MFVTMAEDLQEKVISRTPLDLTWVDAEELSKFVTGEGKILSRKITGLSAHHQRHITRMIKRARNMLLMK
jgi:small subunit ribosomal protein S18